MSHRGVHSELDAQRRPLLELLNKVIFADDLGRAAAQRAALELSSRINAAYRVVRDPILHAEYLVKLSGIDLDSNDPIQGAPTPTQAFLIQMIELRERLSEEGSAEVRDEIEARADQAFDEAIVALDRADIVTAARELVARRYYQRFLDEVDAGEGP